MTRIFTDWDYFRHGAMTTGLNAITEFSLSNSPNPFNPSTQIVVELPEASDVELSIYNSLGQHVKTLINKPMAKGRHKARFNADNLPSGLYISLLRTNKKVITNKMLLVK